MGSTGEPARRSATRSRSTWTARRSTTSRSASTTSRSTFVTYEQDREIAWTIEGLIKPPIGHVYGYRLEPTDDGTTVVTSYYDWSSIDEVWRERGIFPVIPESALRATLGILARTVAAAPERS